MKQPAWDAPARRRFPLAMATAMVLLLAVYLRANEFLFARSIWMDEAKLALNILDRGYFDLLAPLADDQAAPPGFLWLTRMSTQVFGNGEKALRLPAFLASLLSLPFVYAAARHFLGARGAFFVLLIVAICPLLIRYASEVKQYQFDFLASAMVLHASALHVQERQKQSVSIWLALVGSLTLLISHAVVFVTAGAGLSLLADALRNRRDPGTRHILIAGAWVFLAGLVNYFAFLRPILANDVLISAHARSFPPLAPASNPDLLQIGNMLLKLFNLPLGLAIAPLGAVSFVVGLVWLVRSHRSLLAAIIGIPLVILLAAVITDRYSFFPKYLLFAVPLLALGVSAGIEGLLRSPSKIILGAGCVLALLILGLTGWVRVTDEDFWKPTEKEEIRPVLEYIAGHFEQEDVILLYGPLSTFRYYSERGPLRRQFWRRQRLDDWEHFQEYGAANAPFRMWLIAYHVRQRDRPLLEQRLVQLRTEGRQLDVIAAKGAIAYLFAVPSREGAEPEQERAEGAKADSGGSAPETAIRGAQLEEM